MIRRVLEFQVDDVTPDVVSEVADMISLYDEDTVRTASAGAASFYCWVRICLVSFTVCSD